jgi:hypothetical protein
MPVTHAEIRQIRDMTAAYKYCLIVDELTSARHESH